MNAKKLILSIGAILALSLMGCARMKVRIVPEEPMKFSVKTAEQAKEIAVEEAVTRAAFQMPIIEEEVKEIAVEEVEEKAAIERPVWKEEPEEIVTGRAVTRAAFQMPTGKEKVTFGFEEGIGNWQIPDWTLEKKDYVAEALSWSKAYASQGEYCLKLVADFPVGSWAAAYIEAAGDFDLAEYRAISADIYLPEPVPEGLLARIVASVGKDMNWIESRPFPLEPGQWNTITVDIRSGSADWKKFEPTDSFRREIKKLGIRFESSSDLWPSYVDYKGPIYIDNIRSLQ